jgi:hypothetical protein
MSISKKIRAKNSHLGWLGYIPPGASGTPLLGYLNNAQVCPPTKSPSPKVSAIRPPTKSPSAKVSTVRLPTKLPSLEVPSVRPPTLLSSADCARCISFGLLLVSDAQTLLPKLKNEEHNVLIVTFYFLLLPHDNSLFASTTYYAMFRMHACMHTYIHSIIHHMNAPIHACIHTYTHALVFLPPTTQALHMSCRETYLHLVLDTWKTSTLAGLTQTNIYQIQRKGARGLEKDKVTFYQNLIYKILLQTSWLTSTEGPLSKAEG